LNTMVNKTCSTLFTLHILLLLYHSVLKCQQAFLTVMQSGQRRRELETLKNNFYIHFFQQPKVADLQCEVLMTIFGYSKCHADIKEDLLWLSTVINWEWLEERSFTCNLDSSLIEVGVNIIPQHLSKGVIRVMYLDFHSKAQMKMLATSKLLQCMLW
ncbi:hypothetical protein ACJX0J_020075, partial [Zea mays]